MLAKASAWQTPRRAWSACTDRNTALNSPTIPSGVCWLLWKFPATTEQERHGCIFFSAAANQYESQLISKASCLSPRKRLKQTYSRGVYQSVRRAVRRAHSFLRTTLLVFGINNDLRETFLFPWS